MTAVSTEPVTCDNGMLGGSYKVKRTSASAMVHFEAISPKVCWQIATKGRPSLNIRHFSRHLSLFDSLLCLVIPSRRRNVSHRLHGDAEVLRTNISSN